VFKFEKQSKMPTPSENLFAWHEKPGALERLIPAWEKVVVMKKDKDIKPGSEVHLKTQIGPFKVKWIAQHTSYVPGKEFIDIQLKGPFAIWKHWHQMLPITSEESILKDTIEYEMHFGIGQSIALKSIERMFNYRHAVLKNDLEVQNEFSSPSLNIAITGASGLVGKTLTAFLKTAGHRVFSIVRKSANEGEIFWDVRSQKIDQEKLEGMDAVINLSGENIGSARWSKKKKNQIYNSRIDGTSFLVDVLNKLKKPPKVLLSASAIGYYGSENKSSVDESSSVGNDFLAKVCLDWEREANKFKAGRVVTARLGVVLSPQGGALKKMLLPFNFCLGGTLGSGKQHISWIAIDDLVYNLYRIILDETYKGPINLTSQNPVTNKEFSQTLAHVLRRPAFLPTPAFILRLIFGEMANATILSDIKAIPGILNDRAVKFYYPTLESCLRHLLGK
jgi:uncharacterized protein